MQFTHGHQYFMTYIIFSVALIVFIDNILFEEIVNISLYIYSLLFSNLALVGSGL